MQLEEALDRRQSLRLLARLPQQVGPFDLRLLREQRAGGAALDALVQLDRALVVAERGLFLGLCIQSLGAPGDSGPSASCRSRRAPARRPAASEAPARSDSGLKDMRPGGAAPRGASRQKAKDVDYMVEQRLAARRRRPTTAAERRDMPTRTSPRRARPDVGRRRCHGQRLDKALVHDGAGVLAQPPAAARRARPRPRRRRDGDAARPPAARRPARRRRPRADGREPRFPGGAHRARPRLRVRARPRRRQAGRPRRPSGAGQLVGDAAERPARAPSGRGRVAARRHRASAGQGHVGADGRRQDTAGGDRARARHRRPRRPAPLPCACPRQRGVVQTIDAPIGRDPASRVRMAVVGERQAGAHRRRGGSSSAQTASAPCDARCTPGARTRSASTSRRAAIRSSPTPSTAAFGAGHDAAGAARGAARLCVPIRRPASRWRSNSNRRRISRRPGNNVLAREA